MTDADLVLVRDALSAIIALPAAVRSIVVSLIAPAAAPEPHKGNGAAHGPPPALEALRRNPDRAPRPKAKAKAKPKRSKPTPAEIVANENALLDAMRDNPGVGVMALARSLSANTSTTIERLKRLQRRGEVERDAAAGMWRLPFSKSGDFSPSSVPASQRPVSLEAGASSQSLPLHRLNVRQNLPYQPKHVPSSEEPDLQRPSSGLKPSARELGPTSPLPARQDQKTAENSRVPAAATNPPRPSPSA